MGDSGGQQSVGTSTKTAVMGSLLLAVVIVFSAIVYTTRANIVTSELRAAGEQADRLYAAAFAEVDSLDRSAAVWASAEGAIEWALEPSSAAEADPVFEQAGLSAVMVRSSGGELVYSWSDGTIASSPEVAAVRERGFHASERAIFAVVPKAVQSPPDDPETYTAVFVRRADLARAASLAGLDANRVDVRPATRITSNGGAMVRSAKGTSMVELVRPHTLYVHTMLPGSSGLTVAVLTAEVESVGYKGAPQLVGGTVAVLLIAGLLWGGVTLGMVERFSISRVTWLKSAVSALGRCRQTGVRLAVQHGTRDEIAEVASEINKMLDGLEHARRSEHEAEALSRALIDNMVDAVLVLDASGRIIFANGRAGELAGHAAVDLQGRHYRDVLAVDQPNPLDRLLDGRLAPEAIGIVETTVDRPDGSRLWLEISVSTFLHRGRVEAVQLTARDVTERCRLQQELVWLADHDHLTGLFNRKRFEEELERELIDVARNGADAALLWLDLDGFKTINDVHGHRAGDEVLIRLAETLRHSVRGNHPVARIGGDEFAVLVSRADADEAECVAHRLLEAARTCTIEHEGQQLHVTASLGIALIPKDGTSIAELLSHADIAMYQAKQGGKGHARRYSWDEDREHRLVERQAWGLRIEEALRDERFIYHCQPIVDLATGDVARYEMLVRLDDEGTVVPPSEFLCHAEELGLVNRIDSWMVDQAISMVLEGLNNGSPLSLSVNLSGCAFSDDGFLDLVFDRLRAHPEVCPHLAFEITETSLIRHMPAAASFSDRLRALGCTVCLDDFGSGFSSFYYLRHLPVGVLKIDRELTKNISRSKKDMRLIAGIAEMAAGLGMQVVAEGVESEHTADLLRQLGVPMGQGYHLGMPQPTHDIVAGLTRDAVVISDVG